MFTEHGEPYFREGERKVLARLMRSGPQVLATGGGAFMNAETRTAIAERGISVWLKAELPLLVRRVSKRNNRPLLKGGDPQTVMQNLMDVRYPVYAQADITVESRDVPHDVIVAEIIELLSRPLPSAARREEAQ
jgi:shikimate kinase